jgi:predicted negative regulator of RcsB-dependent stress response
MTMRRRHPDPAGGDLAGALRRDLDEDLVDGAALRLGRLRCDQVEVDDGLLT